MERQARRRRPDFWRDYGDYLKSELLEILKLVALCLIFLYLSMYVPPCWYVPRGPVFSYLVD